MAEESHGTVGQVKRVVNVTVSTGSRWAARSKARLAKPFDEAGLAGMGHADRVDPGPEFVRLALARRQVAEVHEQLHRRIVAFRLLRGNQVLDLVPQLRLPSGDLVEVLRPQDRRLPFTSRLLLCSLLGSKLAAFLGMLFG